MEAPAYTRAYTRHGIECPVCGTRMSIRSAAGRKSKKLFVMIVCPISGSHFRGFIGDQGFVSEVIRNLETGQE